MITWRKWAVGAALATLLGACQGPAVVKSWAQVKKQRLEPYEKVLVVSLNESNRVEWEDAVVDLLADLDVTGMASYPYLAALTDAKTPAFANEVRGQVFEGLVVIVVTDAGADDALVVTPDSRATDVISTQVSATVPEGDFSLEVVVFDCRDSSPLEWKPVWAGRSRPIASDVAPEHVGKFVVGSLEKQELF